jgi:uncharacterized protein
MSDRAPPVLARGRNLVLGFIALLVLVLASRWAVSLYVDLLWYRAEGAARVFWTRALWEWGTRIVTALATGIVLALNLRPVVATYANLQIRRRFGDLVIQERLPAQYLRWAVRGLAALGAFWFAAAIPPGTGLQALLALRGPEAGVLEPVLSSDLGFHFFRLPFLLGLVTWSVVLVVFSAALVVAGYSGSGGLRVDRGRVSADPLPLRHLATLLAVLLLLVSLRLALAPYTLLADGSSAVQGIVGSVDVTARIPALRLAAFLAFATAAAAGWGALRGRILPGLSGAGALAVVSILLLQLYPAFVQRFQVGPNEIARESPHIERAIEATRSGFGLSDLRRERFGYAAPTPETWDEATRHLPRIPVWTAKTLAETFQQLEARFGYYRFSGITFDRYAVGDSVVPVALGVREVSPANIPAEGRNWQNLHLRERYVAGVGAVAGPSNRQNPEGRMPTWLGALPPEFRAGEGVPEALRLVRPQIHVGTTPQLYSVISPGPGAFEAPDGSPGTAGIDFPEGVRVGGLLRRAALAWHFQDLNLLISDEVGPESRLVFRRDVASRLRALAPFLHLPEAPYAVIHDGRVQWIVEGYTLSRRYPLSVAHTLDPRTRANYVRNAVKATVDAVTGEATLYVADPEDLLLAGWSRAFPGLLRPLDEMPAGLAAHLRYPKWLMDVQVEVLLRYHQDSPPVFHGQQDRWAVPVEIPDAAGPVPYRPAHALLTLPGETDPSWVLSTVFIPVERQNLASFLTGRWVEGQGAELRLWDVPQEDQVEGPRQVAALVEQDAAISEQFSLWRRGGSDVSTGHLQIVPVGSTLVYIEPVFLAAESEAIPEIRRYIVSDGRRVAMEPSLAGAISALRGGGPAGVPGARVEETGDPSVADFEEIRGPEAFPGLGEPGARRALELLEAAEQSLRDGDWEGFGRRLEELRAFLRSQATPPGDTPGPG